MKLTPREEAIALRRAALLEHWNFTSVTTAANNARAAGTTLSTTNMHVFLGDAATAQPSPDQFGSRTYRMNPQWQPGQGPPPAFDANGAPIAGSVGTVVGGVNRGTRSGSSLNWPPPPATPGQLAEYDRQVNLMRAGQSIVTGVGQQSLPPPANPRTVELFVHRNQANVGLEDLNEYASRMVIDAMRCDAGAANPSNIFFGKPALLAAFKSGDAAAFAAALG